MFSLISLIFFPNSPPPVVSSLSKKAINFLVISKKTRFLHGLIVSTTLKVVTRAYYNDILVVTDDISSLN